MRTEILDLLRSADGQYVSGEEIARRLNVSRTAIWKHMQELKQAGYAIESQSRSGYRLAGKPDLLLPEEIDAALTTKTLGRTVYHFDEVDSTNNRGKTLAMQGALEGAIIVSETQGGGRGRLSRGWFSPRGKGVWFSIVLRPRFLPQEAPKCTLLAAVAIVKGIRAATGIEVGIKWPNDILYEGKKIVGILTEMSAEMDGIAYVVIGMGINVNISQDELPEEIRGTATSLSAIGGRSFRRLDVLAASLAAMEPLYERVQESGFAPVLDEWRKYAVTLGQEVNVISVDQVFSGVAMDIDDDGALLVKKPDGTLERVLAGDVSIRTKQSAR